MNVWEYFKNLFQEAEKSSASKPLIHEAIERDEKEIQAFIGWKNSPAQQFILDWISDQYGIWKALPNDIDDSILFLNTLSSKGFAVQFTKGNGGRDS